MLEDERRWKRLASTILLVSFCSLLFSGFLFLPIDEPDVRQLHADERISVAGQTIGQTFFVQGGELSAVELRITEKDTETDSSASKPLVKLFGLDPERTKLTSLQIDTAAANLDKPVRIDFKSLPHANGHYYLEVSGSPDSKAEVWYSTVDGLRGGSRYVNGNQVEGDLYLSAYTSCAWSCLAGKMYSGLGEFIKIGAFLVILFFLPGWLALNLFRQWPHEDFLVRLGVAVCFSFAVIPVAWLLLTTFGIRVGSFAVRVGYGTVTVAAGLWLFTKLRMRKQCQTDNKINWAWLVVLFLIIGLIVSVRILQIRNVLLPPWVDSIKHASIIEQLLDSGHVPAVFPGEQMDNWFIYHFGYHSFVATLVLFSGLPVAQTMLYFGQFLSMLAPVSTYALVVSLSKNRLAGLFALIVVGLVSIMPARYISWGRYTLLSGMMLLPVTLLFTTWLLSKDKLTRFSFATAAMFWACVALTHYRVALFGAVFLLLWYLAEMIPDLWYRRTVHTLSIRRLGLLAFASLILIFPWINHLIHSPTTKMVVQWALLREQAETLIGATTMGLHNFGYLFHPKDWLLMTLVIVGLIFGVVLRRKVTLIGMVWIVVLFVLANPAIFSPNIIPLSDNLTFASIIYLPIVLIGSDLLVGITDFAEQRLLPAHNKLVQHGLLGILLIVAIWTSWLQINMIPPGNVLADTEDLEAIRWIDENLPPQASFLINTRYWADNTYVGSDAGYWISALASRATTLPATNYALGTPASVTRINELARRIAEKGSTDLEELHSELLQRNITHVFIGSHGGPLKIDDLVQDPNYDTVFAKGTAWIFVDRAAIDALDHVQLQGDDYPLEILFRRQYLPFLQIAE